MNALLLVDLQNDFLPGGALAVPHSQDVLPVANAAIDRFAQVGHLIVATQDFHPPHHRSFASQHPGKTPGDVIDLHGHPQVLWPDLWVQGTPGAVFAQALNTTAIHKVFPKGTDPAIDSYSGFFDNDHQTATGLGGYLHAQNITDLTVLGLATDYCVKATVLDALALGFNVTLLPEGIRGVDLTPGDSERAIGQMQRAGARTLQPEESMP